MLLKSKIHIKENLHTDTWKSELHFEEDVSHDLSTIQNPDLIWPVFSIVLWLNISIEILHILYRDTGVLITVSKYIFRMANGLAVFF